MKTNARKPWDIRPATKSVAITVSIKAEVEAKANEFIESVLKPKHVRRPLENEQFNYVSDIKAKWIRNFFYFISVYTCPRPNAIEPTFESKFARMEPLGNDTFAQYAMRYTGTEWVGVFDALLVDECMKAISDDEWFKL